MSEHKDTATSGEEIGTPGKLLLGRHYKPALGIDDVFLEPPSHSLPCVYLGREGGKPPTSSFLSTEIVGRIKTTPEDFIVQEIMDFPNTVSVIGGVVNNTHDNHNGQDTVHIATFNDNPLEDRKSVV